MESSSAFVTFSHQSFGSIDVKISRDIVIKKIIINLFDAISQPLPSGLSFYIKAMSTNKLIFPNSMLKEFQVYDGEILQLL